MAPRDPQPAPNSTVRKSTKPAQVRLFRALKRLLRERGLRYRDLATALDLSEATVKKFMAEGQIDLDRLLRICDWLGVELSDLLALSDESRYNVLTFTPAQETAFAADMNLYRCFEALRKGQDLATLVDSKILTATKARDYLQRLDQLGLIRITPRGDVEVLYDGSVTVWDDYGPMGQCYSRYYIEAMAGRATENLRQRRPELGLWTGSRAMTEDDYLDFRNDLEQLIETYRLRMIKRKRLAHKGSAGLKDVQFLFITDQWHDPYFSEFSADSEP